MLHFIFLFSTPGKYVASFQNSYSWIIEKDIWESISVLLKGQTWNNLRKEKSTKII